MNGQAPRVRLLDVEFAERPAILRLPFKFGSHTLTRAPQAFVRVRLEVDGTPSEGVAAELLAPKWFDKNPDLDNAANFRQLRFALRQAAALYSADAQPGSAFALHARHAPALYTVCREAGCGGLIASYGSALLDRAILDALCRACGVSIFDAIHRNLPGIDARTTPDLLDVPIDAMLAQRRATTRLAVRHTIGMADPIRDADIDTPLNDGLPESLEQVIARYGVRHFKIKIGADTDAAVQRLRQIATVIDALPHDYLVTLDGNEQFQDAVQLGGLFDALERDASLARLWRSTRYVEQPISRERALDEPVHALAQRKPLALDESEAHVGVFPVARALGYAGLSSKSCKGFYRALLNALRVARWNRDSPPARCFMIAEDLSTQAGISVQQDCALAALVGVTHVERNGHHYVRGFGSAPMAEQQAFLHHHPDLYEADEQGRVQLRILAGELDFGSLHAPGLASACWPDWSSLHAMPEEGVA